MTSATAEDLRWLDAAVRVARPYRGTTAENPAAAALIVDQATGVLIARGVTAPGGRPHAEALALEEAGEGSRGKTLYVTIEPCNHWGRTPPCSDAVIRAGIARVVIGMLDPDSRTSGQGARRLADAGIEVVLVDHEPSRRLHEGHATRHQHARPFVTLKLVVSPDGMISKPGQGGFAVAGKETQLWTQSLRTQSDAVLIGAATANGDDPDLIIRLAGMERRTPLRVILAGASGVNPKLNLIAGFTGHRVAIIATSDTVVTVPSSIEVMRVSGEDGRPDLREALTALGRKGITHLLVEGGAALTESFLVANLVDRFHLVTTPLPLGPGGKYATAHGTIEHRLAAAGLVPTEKRVVGADTLRTFEKPASA